MCVIQHIHIHPHPHACVCFCYQNTARVCAKNFYAYFTICVHFLSLPQAKKTTTKIQHKDHQCATRCAHHNAYTEGNHSHTRICIYICVRVAFLFCCMCVRAATRHTIEIWLILPVVICLFQGLSHACLRITAFAGICAWLITSDVICRKNLAVSAKLDNLAKRQANT